MSGKKDDAKEKQSVGKPAGTSTNHVVRQDGILKETVGLQELAERCWESKWGFMTKTNFLKVLEEEADKAGLSLERVRQRGRKRRENANDETTVGMRPSPPIPKTSSGFIGWRSSLSECTLEKVGPMYISPVLTIEPPPKPGKHDNKRQNVIFIG